MLCCALVLSRQALGGEVRAHFMHPVGGMAPKNNTKAISRPIDSNSCQALEALSIVLAMSYFWNVTSSEKDEVGLQLSQRACTRTSALYLNTRPVGNIDHPSVPTHFLGRQTTF